MHCAEHYSAGIADGSYKPEGNIKRSEITKMICVALNGGKEPNVGTNVTPTFSDVRGTSAAWAEGYIESHHLRRGRRPVPLSAHCAALTRTQGLYRRWQGSLQRDRRYQGYPD